MDFRSVRFALAIGVSYSVRDKEAVAVAMPMRLDGTPIDESHIIVSRQASDFPYIPGMFVYREGPAICSLLNGLPGLPSLLVFDAQGTAHPRRFGLAAHIGVLYDVPTIGLTRKLLIGRAPALAETDGARSFIKDREGKVVGLACRLRSRCEPIYLSPGHRADMSSLVGYVEGIKSVRSCFPAALALVHERANHLANTGRTTDGF
ncbi:endonuclease V [Geodermatophilus sp. DSM 44513]|nr:endonuclease V [Geodermatophilus sp. DSM 44513]WNV77836.1 endonuclease V [Geodermatophilus sp. DSM 44513]